MRGRKPKPPELRLAEGKRGHRPIKHGPKIETVGALEPPSHLSAAAKTHWHRILPALTEIGMLGRIDAETFGLYCESLAKYVAALRRVERQPTLPNGRRNPNWVTLNECRAAMLKIASEYGMTPASRVRLASNDNKPTADDFENFVAEAS